jgi:DNA-binding response OmpR family regulator
MSRDSSVIPKASEQTAIWVAGHEEEVEREDGVASAVLDLGAPVRLIDLWGTPQDRGMSPTEAPPARLVIVEVLDRPDLLPRALKSLRGAAALHDAPVLAVIGPRSIAQLEPASGHDDFLVWPAPPSELYARIRQLEWKSSAYADDETIKMGPLVIDVATREVAIAGAEGGSSIGLTAREFALLVALVTRRGRVLTRETLLDVVWGADYDGGAKTVDVHVRRLRAKLGEALPLQTIRGAGYVLR